MIYIIGSLRNPYLPELSVRLREEGHDVFDDWFAAGPEADDKWKAYEQQRGRTYGEALRGAAAENVFRFDHRNLNNAKAGVLVLPAGKSGHLELGWLLGKGTPGYVLFPEGEPEDRWDVMYQFAHGVFFSSAELIKELSKMAHPF